MSDTKYWRLREWLMEALKDGPLSYHELSSRLEEKDKFFAGMTARAMVAKGELDWDPYKRTFTLQTPNQKETK